MSGRVAAGDHHPVEVLGRHVGRGHVGVDRITELALVGLLLGRHDLDVGPLFLEPIVRDPQLHLLVDLLRQHGHLLALQSHRRSSSPSVRTCSSRAVTPRITRGRSSRIRPYGLAYAVHEIPCRSCYVSSLRFTAGLRAKNRRRRLDLGGCRRTWGTDAAKVGGGVLAGLALQLSVGFLRVRGISAA